MKSTPLGMMVTDKKGKIITVNPSFTKVTGFDEEEIVGKNPNILQSGKQSDAFYEELWKTLLTKGAWQGEIWNKRKDGRLYLEWLTINAIYDDAGEVIQYAGVFSEVTDKAE